LWQMASVTKEYISKTNSEQGIRRLKIREERHKSANVKCLGARGCGMKVRDVANMLADEKVKWVAQTLGGRLSAGHRRADVTFSGRFSAAGRS
jgi:hypothetical protein